MFIRFLEFAVMAGLGVLIIASPTVPTIQIVVKE